MVSVIIINYNTPEMTKKVITNLFAQEPEQAFEIILIDNASKKPLSLADLPQKDYIYIKNQENLGFAKAVNQGLAIAKGEYILLLNSDVIITEKTVSNLLEYMDKNPNVGICGPQFFYPDNRPQPSCGNFPTLYREFLRFLMLDKVLGNGFLFYKNKANQKYFNKPSQVDWVSGGCMLIRKKLIEQIGSLDKNYFFGFEDVDFCFRAKEKNWQVIFNPLVKIFHYHAYSSGGKKSTIRHSDELEYFFQKHYPNKKLERKLAKLMRIIKLLIFKIVYRIK